MLEVASEMEPIWRTIDHARGVSNRTISGDDQLWKSTVAVKPMGSRYEVACAEPSKKAEQPRLVTMPTKYPATLTSILPTPSLHPLLLSP
jgi:hypothetical protein